MIQEGDAMDTDVENNQKYNKMLVDEEEEQANKKPNKIMKVNNNYRKYIDGKYMEYTFKMEELEELSKSSVTYIF
jgi:hypothetical protein